VGQWGAQLCWIERLGRGNSFQRIQRNAINISALQKPREEITFKLMPKLLIAIFADLEFTESDEVEIKYDIILFVFCKLSQKIRNLREIIRPSGCLQNFVIQTLYPEAISESGKLRIFFIQCFHKVQNFLRGRRIEFYTEFCEIL
jgi:hypothetical protein